MRLVVIGSKGIVGGATYELLTRLGHEVTGVDKGDRIPEPIPGTDVAFVCVPEDSVQDVFNEMPRLYDLAVLRSSVMPGVSDALQRHHKIHVTHNPEFLREATAVLDELNPERIVLGVCCNDHAELLKAIYKPLQRPIITTTRRTSELVKLATNAYLATLISFWNEIEGIASRIKVSGHEVGMIASTDSRIVSYGSRAHHKYGGKCLPKDIRQLIVRAESLGLEPNLLRAVEEVNDAVWQARGESPSLVEKANV